MVSTKRRLGTLPSSAVIWAGSCLVVPGDRVTVGPRIAFVVPRYGADVLGGAETLCRLLAQNLKAHGADVTVLTTCARDHFTWRNEHSPGLSMDNGVPVHRFPVAAGRRHERWLELHERIGAGQPTGYVEQLEWMANSVTSDELIDSAVDQSRFDWVIPIPYLFGTTFWTAAARPDRCCPIPCMHDEPHGWTPVVRGMLRGVRGLLANSVGERDLISRMAPTARTRVVGVGYDEEPVPSPQRVARFCAERNIAPGYLLYAGRREVGKGIGLLFSHYAAYRRAEPSAPPLALMGGGVIEPPEEIRQHVIDLGYVAADDMMLAYQAASVFVHPSTMESLGMVLLESWRVGTPALVNGESVVLRRHCQSAAGGLWFQSEDEFCGALDLLLGDGALRRRLGDAGRRYVLSEFSWQAVRERFLGALAAWA